MGMPQARVTDIHLCPAPSIPPPPLPVPIPIIPPGCPTCLVSGLPAARMLDMTAAVPPHPIIKGSMTVMIGMMPAARMIQDMGACGGPITLGAVTVLTGG